MNIKITRQFFDELRDALLPRITEVGKELGVDLQLGNGSYDREGLYGKLTLEISALQSSENGNGPPVTTDKYAVEWTRQAKWLGLNPEWLGKTFTDSRRIEQTIVGLNTRAWKMPVLTRGSNGKLYKFPVDMVVRHMGGDPAAVPPVRRNPLHMF